MIDLRNAFDDDWNETGEEADEDDGMVCAAGYGPDYVEYPEHDFTPGHPECSRCGAEAEQD